MASFISKKTNLSTTSFRLVEAADFDRQVQLWSNDSTAKFAYREADIGTTATLPETPTGNSYISFVLPAREEVWVEGNASFQIEVLVSAVP